VTPAVWVAGPGAGRERGCRCVELDVDEGRTGAREMYRRLRFTEDRKNEPPERTLWIAHWLRSR
jgi:ribosomal protein S18 acetylase RimI-like enzyme